MCGVAEIEKGLLGRWGKENVQSMVVLGLWGGRAGGGMQELPVWLGELERLEGLELEGCTGLAFPAPDVVACGGLYVADFLRRTLRAGAAGAADAPPLLLLPE